MHNAQLPGGDTDGDECRHHGARAPKSAAFTIGRGAGDLSVFARTDVLGLTADLTLAAIVGKQLCSLGAIDRSLDRLSIGIGTMPRGEIGLIFAKIVGLGLSLAGQPIVDEGIFSAVVIMIIVTTMATPPLLKWSLARR